MKLMHYLLILLAGLACCACDDSEGNPAFASDEVYIYDQTAATLSATVGTEFEINPIVSPNDGSVECRWLLTDESGASTVIGTTSRLLFTFDAAGAFTLRFEAERGGRIVSKSYALTVN